MSQSCWHRGKLIDPGCQVNVDACHAKQSLAQTTLEATNCRVESDLENDGQILGRLAACGHQSKPTQLQCCVRFVSDWARRKRTHGRGRRKSFRRKVPEAGLEPARSCDHWILSPGRLPFRHSGEWYSIRSYVELYPLVSAFCVRIPSVFDLGFIPGDATMKKPYYRGGRQRAWFYDAEIIADGKPKRKQVRLTERCEKNDDSESAAFRRWNEIRDQQPAETTTGTVNALVIKFLEWSKVNTKDSTHQFYWSHCTAFADIFGHKLADDVTHDDIDAWLDSEGKPRIGKNGKPTAGVTYRGRSDDYKANGCRALARCFNWGRKRKIKQGPRLCTLSPLEDYEGRPVAEPRETYIEPVEWDRLLSSVTDEHFRDIATFLRLTGCRPIEARILNAAHWDGELTVTFARKESKGRKRKPPNISCSSGGRDCCPACRRVPARRIVQNTRG